MSAKARKMHARRKRRQNKAKLRHGRKAAPRHTSKGGRTGQVHTRKLRSMRDGNSKRKEEKGN